AFAGLAAVAVMLLVAASVWLRSGAGEAFLRREVVERAGRQIHGTLSVGRLSGSVLSGVRLDDVRVTDEDGRLVASARSLTLRYHLWSLLFGRREEIAGLALDQAELRIFTRPDGRSDLAALMATRARPGKARLVVDDVRIEGGRVVWIP